METLEPILSQHPFFKDMNPDYLKIIVGCASNVKFDAEQFIFHQGEDAKKFYLIRQGKVNVEIVSQQAPVVIQTLGEGDVLGWSWLVPPYKWNFDAWAVELTRAIAIDGECLRKKSEDNHDLGYELMKRFTNVIIQRLQSTTLQLIDIYGNYS